MNEITKSRNTYQAGNGIRKLDRSLESKIDAQDMKNNVLIWIMEIGFTLILAFIFFGGKDDLSVCIAARCVRVEI